MDHLQKIKLATSLGGVTSLANQPITNTHAALSSANRAKAGVSENLVRLSVGIEKTELLIRDLDMTMIKEVRDQWAFYRDRRPEMYGELTEQ